MMKMRLFASAGFGDVELVSVPPSCSTSLTFEGVLFLWSRALQDAWLRRYPTFPEFDEIDAVSSHERHVKFVGEVSGKLSPIRN